MDLDLRKIRYFLAVAEELNFGRAAQELHIAQPVLSRQIRALEADLGVQLFVRGKQRTELTAAGEQLRADAGPLLAGADALRRRIVGAARTASPFTIGFMPGLIVTSAVRAFAAAHPELNVELLRTSMPDQTDVLRDGRADVSYVRLPVDLSGVDLVALFDEPRVVIFPADHALAGKREVRLTDLAGDTLLQPHEVVPEWRTLTGDTSPRVIPLALAIEEKLEHVAAGKGVIVLAQSAATFYQRADISYAVITDIDPCRVALAWAADRRSPLVREFTDLAARGYQH
jgi:DNA-binding transcriptional LysR family regulator